MTSWWAFMKFLNSWALSFWLDIFTNSSFCLSSSWRIGILSSSSYLVDSNLSLMLLYRMASKTFFKSISVLVPSIFWMRSSFFWKYFSFLEFSHHCFHVLNFIISFSAYEFMTACFIERKTFCLYHILVISSDIVSYLSSRVCLLEWANHMINAFLSPIFFFFCMIEKMKSCWLSFLRQTSLQRQM